MARVLGYWLLYATVGVLLVVMMIAGGGDLGSEDRSAPTRMRTKILGACSGAALGIAALGAYLLSDTGSWLLFGIAAPIAVGLIVWSWTAIARDLRRHGARAR